MRRVKIVTHNGSAHRDDFLACCVVLFHEYSKNLVRPKIERRAVSALDMENTHTYVIDVGGQWDPGLLNFDHHQPDPRLAQKCALDLVLEYVMSPSDYGFYSKSNDWLRLTAVQDTKGGVEAAAFLSVSAKAYTIMRSPIEQCMLKWFSDSVDVHPDSPLYLAMMEIGRTLLVSVPDFDEQAKALSSIPGPVLIGNVKVWDVRAAWDIDIKHSFAVLNDFASRLGVDVVVGHNFRNKKVGLYRQEWANEKVDLARIHTHPKHFSSHMNGFYAVVETDVSPSEIREMIEMATIRNRD